MNKVILIGRLTRDPEIRYPSGDSSVAVARYTLAVDRIFKREGEQTADFISCVCFGKTAEFAEKYLRQGAKIAITGQIRTGSYVNKEGTKVYTTDVVVDGHEFCESKSSASAGNTENGSQKTTTRKSSKADSETDSDGFMSIPDGIEEELPFA